MQEFRGLGTLRPKRVLRKETAAVKGEGQLAKNRHYTQNPSLGVAGVNEITPVFNSYARSSIILSLLMDGNVTGANVGASCGIPADAG